VRFGVRFGSAGQAQAAVSEEMELTKRIFGQTEQELQSKDIPHDSPQLLVRRLKHCWPKATQVAAYEGD
jgi:hypothetical protein